MEYKIRYGIINQIGYMCRYDLSLSQAKKQFNELKNNPLSRIKLVNLLV